MRVGAGLLAAVLFLTNTVYPTLSLIPAPPIVVAQEESPIATTSAEATPAASVATPAPTPLDPLDNLDSLLLPSSPSAEIILPEEAPETTPSASSTPTPEEVPEDQTSTPSANASPNLGSQDLPGLLPSPSPSPSPIVSPVTVTLPQSPLPPLLSPFNIRLAYPFVGNHPISYGFGETSGSSYVRLMQTLFKVDAHDGIDFALPEGTEIIAADDGEVIHASSGIYGQTVIIKHNWGNSYYGHLSAIKVVVGAQVLKGELIALSGSSGISTGPHLHFGIRPSHYDPFNGYHGMVDPLPYLSGTVLGSSTSTKYNLIHLPYKTLTSDDPSISIPVLATASGLTYRLTNPKGESKIVYPSIYNYGTGDTAILPRPTPFIPGEYELTVTDLLGNSDSVRFSWGVVTLNTNQSRYILGQNVEISLAVLDEVGEMVCDADLILNVTSPTGAVETLTTDNALITRNIAVCQSKDLTLTPDYEGSFTPSEVGTHNITLTAITPKHTFTMTDSFEVVETLPYTLERLATTRIFPGNVYPVILKVTAHQDLNSQLVEQVPNGFSTTPAGSTDFAPWVSPDDLATIHPSPYTRTENSSSQSLSWDLDLKTNQSVILGYTYDAPDESPTLYTLGPINFAGITESRSWNIAIDSVDPNIGYFSPPPTWTTVGDSNISLPYPDPRNGDLVLATVAVRPSTVTIATPAGWTSLGSWSGGDGGAEGADTGSVSQYWFYQTADGSEGSSTETFTKTGTASVITGNIMQIRSGTGTYDLAAGGYSINADATNWNGTLDSDIGVVSGDLIIITGAQNGDLSATSAWNIAATNVTTKGTVNEHGEFTNTTGNDIEVGLATTQIWEANNTTTPTITLTQSVAASGVVTAIRIRQGSGTNRTDAWVRGAGRQVAGTTSVAPAYPEHDYGDLLLLFVGSRASADNTPTTPAGWTSLGSYNGGVGTFGADAGNARSTVFYREATARLTGTVTVSITSGNTAIGQIVSIHRDDAESWVLDSDGGTDSTAGTSWSTTGSGIDLDSANGGDILLVGNSINTDAYTYSSYSLSASGITFGDVTETSEFTTTGGNDMGLTVGNGRISSGSASNVAPTFTMTSSGSATNSPAGASIFVKVSATSNTTTTKAVGFFTPPATWTSAGNANLSLAYPDPRSGDLMLAITAIRPAASTVDTPAGWTLVDSRTGTDGGAEAADTGSVGIYVFSKTADGTEGTGTLAFTETGTTSVWIGNIMKLRSGTGTYSVSGSGYSLNGDTVTWGSTLSADIGLTNGDLVLLAAAQNGDLSNTSVWDISATGITQKSTFNEHGEFGSTTGNDIEVGLASGIIWGGTNSATPTLTLTQSAAASGVVSAIRIREDTGTQRADTWVRSASPQVVSTTTTLNLVYPEHEIGDMFVMFVSTRGTSDPTLLDPYGWTSLGSYNGGAGTFGVDAGNARVTAYYREATSRRWGTQAVILTSADVAIGQILAIHTKDIDTWSIDSDGGTDTSAGTSWSVSGSGIDFNSGDGGDLVLVGSAVNTDAYTYSAHALSASGITFGEVTQTATYNTTSGSDSNLNITTSRVTAGSGSPAPTFTMTASGSTANAPAGSSLFVKVYGAPIVPTISIGGSANGNDGATVKVAVNGSIQNETDTISSSAWEITGVAEPNVGDIVTVWVDGVADNLETTAITKYSSGNITGLTLNTNVLSLGSNQDQSVSLTNLNNYDCTQDEDVMHQAASAHLKVEGDACAGSTTNSYTSEKLAILSGDTLTVATSDLITTYDFDNAGTVTVTGNGTWYVSHNWANTGTFNSGTSTVNLIGDSGTTQTLSGNTSFYNLTATNNSWYNASWSYRLKLTIDSTNVAANLTNFPVFVDLNDLGSDFHTNVNQTDARDIRVTKADGSTELPREVVFYNSASDTGELYFMYSGTLSSTADTEVYLYYGNSGASDYATTDTYGRNNVWDSNYVSVYHLNETSGQHLDSTGNHDSSSVTVNQQGANIGQIYTADDFITGSKIVMNDHDDYSISTTNQLTAEAWVKYDTISASIESLNKGYGGNYEWGLRVNTDGGVIANAFTAAGGDYMIAQSGVSEVTTATWYHLAMTFNFSTPSAKIFKNGVSKASTSSTNGSYANGSSSFNIGRRADNSRDTDGVIDEIRISNTARSDDWLATQYANQNASSSFYTAGVQEDSTLARTLTFTAGTTQTVTNNWTVTGSSGNLITLQSSAASAWTINPTAANVSYVDVSYSTNTGVAFCATYSTNSNNNTGWSISGTGSCNTAPNAPTSLAQKTTGDVTLATGAWHNSTSLKFTATATDTDNPDTLQLCVEVDQLGTSFSNTEDSCGSGVSYAGSGITVTHTLTLTDAQEYHWQARVKDAGGLYSSWVSYDVNAESARDLGVDTTAPTGGTVYDGTNVGVDTTFATNSLSSLSANWASFNTDVSGLARYDYSIGTSAGATDIKAWTDNSTNTSVTATGLTLQTSQLYYVNVRAVDNAGNVQTAVSSNGQLVSPSISFSISPATTTFTNLGAGNSYSDTEVTTLTTSTNAYNGYIIRAFTTDLLKTVGGTHQIENFSAGSYASPASWSGSETGFGYTSSDTSIQGSDKFGSGTLYAPFSQTGPGDIVADHTSAVTGTSISNEAFNITYKVKVPSSQAAANYTSTVVYTATAQY